MSAIPAAAEISDRSLCGEGMDSGLDRSLIGLEVEIGDTR